MRTDYITTFNLSCAEQVRHAREILAQKEAECDRLRRFIAYVDAMGSEDEAVQDVAGRTNDEAKQAARLAPQQEAA